MSNRGYRYTLQRKVTHKTYYYAYNRLYYMYISQMMQQLQHQPVSDHYYSPPPLLYISDATFWIIVRFVLAVFNLSRYIRPAPVILPAIFF